MEEAMASNVTGLNLSSLMADPWAEGYTADYKAQYLAEGPTGWTPPIGKVDTSTGSVVKDWLNGPNLLNASITAALTGIGSFVSAWSSKGIYDMYKQQEQMYIDNANEQARRLQIKGDIALANLAARHAVSQGKNELAVAASGAGSMSGSFVDALAANQRYDIRDEYTQSLSTLYQVSNAKRDGLLQAYSTAGVAYGKAIKQRNAAITGLFKGLAAGVQALAKDKQLYDASKASEAIDASKIQLEHDKHEAIWKLSIPPEAEREIIQQGTEASILGSEIKYSEDNPLTEQLFMESYPWLNYKPSGGSYTGLVDIGE